MNIILYPQKKVDWNFVLVFKCGNHYMDVQNEMGQ